MPGRPSAAHPAAFPNSPQTAALPNSADGPAFPPALEAAFSRLRLAENRTLIRVTSVVALLLAATRGAEQILLESWTPTQLGQFAVVIAISIVLAGLAWSRWYQRLYLPFAQALVPVRGLLIAVTVAGVAARGQVEALMLLPVLVIGPFLVFGLSFRAAGLTVACTITAYTVAAVSFGLAPALIARSCILLLVVAGACGVVARTLERTARARFLETRAMAELAHQDALTGVKNRRVFDEHLERLWQHAANEECGVAILLVDVDHFKAYNDRYGHQAGDRALRLVAQVLQRLVSRPQDLLARYGGEEFAVLLYDVDVAEIEKLAQRLRKAVAGLALEHRDSGAGVVTISVGVAIVEPSLERHARGAVQLADEALYQAKTRGRNRVEFLNATDHRALETGVFTKSMGAHG